MHSFELRLLLCLASILFLQKGYGQTQGDSISTDTLRNKFVPTGIRVGYDVINLAKSRFQDNYNGWEIEADVDFSRYFLVFEYGAWSRDLRAETASYANDGDYWRVGIDVNFLPTDPDRNVFFLGARYGRSVFSEVMSVARQDPAWGELSETFFQSDVNARWFELTAGLRVHIWKIFWMGYTSRLKFALATDTSDAMLPYDVPGYGRTDKGTTWGFNYYVMVRIPIRDAPVPPARKKRK